MLKLDIQLELTEIGSITPRGTDYGGDAVIIMECTLTVECARDLENRVLYSLRERNLTDVGIVNLADYIAHIGRRSFNNQLNDMGYKTILTEKAAAELFDVVDKRS